MAVEVLADPVVTHRGARICVPGRDPDIPQVHASIEHDRDKGVAEHVRVLPDDPQPGGFGEAPQAAGGGVAVRPGAAAVEQDRSAQRRADRPVDGSADRQRQRDQDDLRSLPHTPSTRWPCSSPMSAWWHRRSALRQSLADIGEE